jgi:hypothetical protein
LTHDTEPRRALPWTDAAIVAGALVAGAARAWALPCPTDNLFHLVRVGRSLLAGSLDAFAFPPGGQGASPLGAAVTGVAALFTSDAELVSRALGAILLGATAAVLTATLLRKTERLVAVFGAALLIVPAGFASSFAARPDSALAGLLLLLALMRARAGATTAPAALAAVAAIASPLAWPPLIAHLVAARGERGIPRVALVGPGIVVILLGGLLAALPAGLRGQLLTGLTTGWGIPGDGLPSSLATALELWGAGILLVVPALGPLLPGGPRAVPGRVHAPWLALTLGALLLCGPGGFRGATAVLLPGACYLTALLLHRLAGPAARRGMIRRPVLGALLIPLVLLVVTHAPEARRRHEMRTASARLAHLGQFFRDEYRPPGALMSETTGALACFSSRPVLTLAASGAFPHSGGERVLPRAVVFERGVWPTTRRETALFANPDFLRHYAPISFFEGPGLRNRDDVWNLRRFPVRLDSLPADYTAALLRGWEAHANGHNEEARTEFETAAQTEPAALGLAHEWAGMMAQLDGEPDVARAFWAQARARDPATWRARGYLADEALAHGLLALADTLLGEALAANAYEGRLWGTAARLRQAQGKLDSAEQTSARAVRLDPTNARILLNHGSLLWQAGLADTARIFWERALAIDPGSIRFLGDFRRAPPAAPPPPLVPLYSMEQFEPVAPGEAAGAEADSS